MVFHTHYADYLRGQLNSENISCSSCLGMGDSVVSGQIFINILNILKIMEKRKTDKNQNLIYFTDSDFEQLKTEAIGLFITKSLDEFYFGFHSFINAFFDELNEKKSYVSYPLIVEIMESAIKINPNILKEFGNIISCKSAEELDASSLNIYLGAKLRTDLLSKISDEKFLKSKISEFHSYDNDSYYSKLEIKSKMTEYKDLVEVKNYLDLLLNLINIIEGRKFIPNPFEKLKLPPMKPAGNERKIKGMSDKIESFKYHSFGNKLYPLLSDIFDLKLRVTIRSSIYYFL